MKKLSVEEEVKRGLIIAKYQFPATSTTYKNGVATSKRVVTHNIKATEELRKLYPSLQLNKSFYGLPEEINEYKPFSLDELGK